MRVQFSACALFLSAALASPAGAEAQDAARCTTIESPAECYSRLVLRRQRERVAADDAITRGVAARQVTDEAEDLRGKTTGPDAAAASASAIRDFLPRLASTLITPGPAEGLSALGLRTNVPLLLNDGVLNNWGLTAQFGATVHEAEPFMALVDSIPTSLREAARTRLQDGMELYDDMSLTGALNVESDRWGRSFRSHREVVQSLTAELFAFSATERGAAANAYLSYVAKLDAAAIDASARTRPECALGQDGVTTVDLACLNPEVQNTVVDLIQRAASAQNAWRTRAERRLRENGFDRISELINSQPQFNATVEYRNRGEVAGPDEWTGKARFEMGRANMNALRRFCARTQGAGRIDLDCLRRFTASDGVCSSLARGGRFFGELTANHRPTYAVSLADEGVDFTLPSATTMALSGGYGAYFGNPDDGANRDRFDLQGKYDFTRNDVLRQDRAVVTAFYTRHLSDQSSVLLGLTWANKPEFVGEVDRKLGARLGFNYKLHQPEKPATEAADGDS